MASSAAGGRGQLLNCCEPPRAAHCGAGSTYPYLCGVVSLQSSAIALMTFFRTDEGTSKSHEGPPDQRPI